MNCRELALVSTAAVFGALASALTCRFFFSNPKRQSAKLDLSKNGVVSGNALLRAVLTLQSAKDICHGMIISWQLHFYQRKDPKTLTSRSLLSAPFLDSWSAVYSELVLNYVASAAGQRLYVTMFPCNECAKIIIQVFPMLFLCL
ncbi:uncharacterized protein [Pyrus communis]|uniref:uncharacterized protein n=1 Tax=Pyrus communis TaxID=23211 RepID=UPI0035C14D1F